MVDFSITVLRGEWPVKMGMRGGRQRRIPLLGGFACRLFVAISKLPFPWTSSYQNLGLTTCPKNGGNYRVRADRALRAH